MSVMKKKIGPVYLSGLIILCLIGIIGILIGSFCDLQISKAIADNDDLFAKIIESFGEHFGMGMGVFGIALITRKLITKESKTWQKALGVFLAIFVIALVTNFGVDDFIGKAGYSWHLDTIWGWVGCGTFYTAIYFIAFFLVDKNRSYRELITNGLIIIITEIIALVLVNFVFKGLVYRCRYRAMAWDNELYQYSALGFDHYTPWYYFSFWQKPDWFLSLGDIPSDTIKSWPSGHTAGAAMALVLPFFTDKMKKRSDKLNLVVYILACIYMFVVAYGRIRKGAHFLSDVSFGGLFTVAVVILVSTVAHRIAYPQNNEKKMAE